MNALITLVFVGGLVTAIIAMLTASGHTMPTPIVVDDNHADIDRVLDAPYTPRCLWWETVL